MLLLLIDELGSRWVRDVVLLEDGSLVKRLEDREVSLKIIPTSGRRSSALLSALRLRRLFKENPPTLVHANGIKAALVAALATFRTTIPVVWMKHDVSLDGYLARFIASRCKRVVGVSDFVLETFGPDRSHKKYLVVYPALPPQGVDREAGRRKVAEVLDTPDPDRVVGLVGRLDAFKGHEELIEAASRVLERHPNTRFVMIGGASPSHPGREALLRALADRRGVSDAITFAGHRDDAFELMSGFDVGVIASVADASGMGREGFSLVGLEYLICGTPVVAYAEGGPLEVLGDCGISVTVGDRRALADAINELLDDAERRASLAACGKKRAEALFRFDRMIDSVVEVYRDAAP